MDTIIRDYSDSDFSECRDLWVELTQHHREIYEDPTIGGGDPGSGFDDYIKHNNLRGLWVADAEGDIVGMTGLLSEGDEVEIEPVVVSISHRSKGIGQMLIERALIEAKALGATFFNVRPVARNISAIEFFMKSGFNVMGRVELFQELKPESKRKWRKGINLHGHSLRY